MSFQSYFNAEMRALQQQYRDSHPADPIVDRILEGTAYLTARLREQLDSDFPEIPAQILHQHWPFMLQDYASRSLLRLSCQTHKTISRGTCVASVPVGEEKTTCKFVTQEDVTLYPIELIKVDIKDNSLVFYFESKQKKCVIPRLRVYLTTDSYTALEIYYAVGQKNHITAENAAQLWMDYFGFREKYLYLDLDNAEACANEKFFERRVPLKYPASLPSGIKASWFAVNTVPVMNVFAMQSEPVLVQPDRLDYRLVPDRHRPTSILLQTMTALSSLARKNIDYVWEHAQQRLVISDNTLQKNTPLSCEIIATNGYYPREYWTAMGLDFVMRPTPHLPRPSYKQSVWNVMRCLNIDVGKIDLCQIQALFNWTSQSWAERQVSSVISLIQKPLHKIIAGVFYQGTLFTVTVNENYFSSRAEIYLWGSVCHTFFKQITPLGHWVETIVVLSPSSSQFTWP